MVVGEDCVVVIIKNAVLITTNAIIIIARDLHLYFIVVGLLNEMV